MSNKFLTALSGLLLVALFLSIRRCNGIKEDLKEEKGLNHAANDTLKKKTNKDGSQTATIELLQAREAKTLLKLQTKDETIKHLQAEVKRYRNQLASGGSVTTFSTATTFTADNKTDSSVVASTGCDSVFYSSNHDTSWVKYSIRATKANTQLNLKVKNAFTVLIGREKIGFMKYRPIAEVTNQNPFTDVKSLRAFEVKDTRPKSRFSLGVQAGWGLLLTGQISTGFYVGIGGNFKLL